MSGGDVEATDSSPDLIWHTGARSSVLPEPLLPSPSKSGAGEFVSPRGPLCGVAAGYASVAVGLLVLLGWAFDIDTLKSVLTERHDDEAEHGRCRSWRSALRWSRAPCCKPPYVPSAQARALLTRAVRAGAAAHRHAHAARVRRPN